MGAVDEAHVPAATAAPAVFCEAMERWDEAKADAAIAGLARSAPAADIWEMFFRFGARDYRSIGHKAIDVANSRRVLEVIGWQYAEPILRSLAYALLMHEDGNPADRDDAADRPWRLNQKLAAEFPAGWAEGKPSPGATRDLLMGIRTGTSEDATAAVVALLRSGIGPAAIWDALFLASIELLVRQPGIVALHSVTTTNALHYAYRTAREDLTRRLVLLQSAAFLPLFHESMRGRGSVGDFALDTGMPPLEVPESAPEAVSQIFREVGADSLAAARRTLGYVQAGGSLDPWAQTALQLIIAKGSDAHDYKFGCAVLEDAASVSSAWRGHFLGGAVFQLQGSGKQDNPIIEQARAALKS